MKRSLTEPLDQDESPCVPGFRTWRAVYLFVFGSFIVTVVLLALLTWAYS
jgi:hypothetical protein